jgi:outer membrane protein assembly factor BamB
MRMTLAGELRSWVLLLVILLGMSAADAAQYPEIMWWYDLDAPSFGSAAVGDIDGDDYPEIVFGTYFGDEHVYALNAEDGTLLWRFNTGGCNDASPAIADVDDDGDLEVIVPASSPYKVYCLAGADGGIEWQRSTGYPNCIDSPPAVADVDQDDSLEVVLGTWHGHVFSLKGRDGSVEWRADLGSDSYIQAGPNLLDVDGNGQMDVVVAQYSGDCRVYALRGTDGGEIWRSNLPTDDMYHGGSFADIDEDGAPEIAIGCYDRNVYVLNAEDGSLCWDYTAPYYIGAPTSLADLDGDGHLELVLASHDRVRVLSHTGSIEWGFNAGGSVFRGAAIADVDGDTVPDVAFGSAGGVLRVLRGSDKQVVWDYDLQAHYGRTYDMDHAPVIADFDLDGELDIFVVGGYGISSPDSGNHGRAYALHAGEGTGPGWPMFRHDLTHSACFGRRTSGVEEAWSDRPVRAESRPNPFRSFTEIRYSLERRGEVSIGIYDISGRLLRVLASGPMEAGLHSTFWDGADRTGSVLPAGVYFCRVTTPDLTATSKIVLLR